MNNRIQLGQTPLNRQHWCGMFAGLDTDVMFWPDEARWLETLSLDEKLELVKTETLKHHPEADLSLLDCAAKEAVEQHGQRLQGMTQRPEIRHAFAVAHEVAKLGASPICVAAAFLHDTLEEGDLTSDDLTRKYGAHMFKLVSAVSWPRGASRQPSEAYVQRRLFSQALNVASKDPDLVGCLLILLAEKLDHVRFSGLHLPREQRLDMARLALKGYSPLTRTLDTPELDAELHDAVLECLFPVSYRRVARQMQILVPERLAFLKTVFSALRELFARMGIDAHMEWRVKRPARAYYKMQRTGRSLSELCDLVGGRIIVETVPDCYLVQSLVESLGRPVHTDFDDYVTWVKSNQYQSLHIVLRSPTGATIEIQIRTWEMHRVAEFGSAKHEHYAQERNRSGLFSLLAPQNGGQSMLELTEKRGKRPRWTHPVKAHNRWIGGEVQRQAISGSALPKYLPQG